MTMSPHKRKMRAGVPTKELCRCRTFCLEDTEQTGRVCRNAAKRDKKARGADAEIVGDRK